MPIEPLDRHRLMGLRRFLSHLSFLFFFSEGLRGVLTTKLKSSSRKWDVPVRSLAP